MTPVELAELKFNSIYFQRGIDLMCSSDKSEYLTVGTVYRAYKCQRFDYKRNIRIDDGYCVENDEGRFKVYSKRLFNQNS